MYIRCHLQERFFIKFKSLPSIPLLHRPLNTSVSFQLDPNLLTNDIVRGTEHNMSNVLKRLFATVSWSSKLKSPFKNDPTRKAEIEKIVKTFAEKKNMVDRK